MNFNTFKEADFLQLIQKASFCFVILEGVVKEDKTRDFLIRYSSKEKIGSIDCKNILGQSYTHLIPDLTHEIFLLFKKTAFEGQETKFVFYDKSNKNEFFASCYQVGEGLCCLILEKIKRKDMFNKGLEVDIDSDVYRMTMENLVDIIFIYDIDSRALSFTKLSSKLDYLENYLDNAPSYFIKQDIVYHEDINEFLRVFDEIMQGNRKATCNIRIRLKNGEYVWTTFALNNYHKDKEKKAIGVMRYVVEEEKKKTLELQIKAERDPLTRLYNKGETEIKISEFLEIKKEEKDKLYSAMLILDIDNFKNLNDSVGHIFGDKVLVEVAAKLKTVFKGTDIIGRVGGDEFMVFIKEAVSREFVINKAEEVCSLIKRTYKYSRGEVSISCSVGVAIYPKHGGEFEQLYRNADIALYKVKEIGKDGFCIYGDKD
ncbi:sensor domain-containing diguanylate cyclase [Selenomonadales bacterium OttesenSCG-928-I06]|nr:sensor domain-containing diguanylate cyclase [Selenomonadales bacterium OttesenSCG-928-I06]